MKCIAEISTSEMRVWGAKQKKAGVPTSIHLPFEYDYFAPDVPECAWAKISDAFSDITKKCSSLLVALNVRRAAFRTADIPTRIGFWHYLSKRRLAKLYEDSFVFGAEVNFRTFSFDGCVFSGANKKRRLLMVALPHKFCDSVTRIAATVAGHASKITRVDFLEHFLLRYFTKRASDDLLIFMPQEGGMRGLAVLGGLPHCPLHITNDNEFRHSELEKFLDGVGVGAHDALQPRAIFAHRADCSHAEMEWEWLVRALDAFGIHVETIRYDMWDVCR